MWKNVLLSYRLQHAILKEAILSGYIGFRKVNTPKEKKYFEEYRRTIFQSRIGKNALIYGLLADNIFIDDLQMHIYDDNIPLEISSHPYLISNRNEVSSIISFTDASRNTPKTLFTENQIRANLFSEMEPMIWRTLKDRLSGLKRKYLREAMKIIVLRPELISLRSLQSKKVIKDVLSQNVLQYKCCRDNINYFDYLCHRIITRGNVSCNIIEEAKRLNAIYVDQGLTFGNNSLDEKKSLSFMNNENIIVSVRIFLKEIRYWPTIENFDELLKVRENKHFLELRTFINRWINSIYTGNREEEKKVRIEIEKANKGIRTVVKCNQIGRWFTYLGLPMLIIDSVLFPAFGSLLTVTGFGIQAISDWKLNKYKWILIGRST